jgi:hypothetical protein
MSERSLTPCLFNSFFSRVRRSSYFLLGVLACLFMTLGCVAVAASSVEVESVSPAEIYDPLDNPFMGWGLWVGPRYFDGRQFSLSYNTTGFGDEAPLFRWVMVDWMWSDLEPEEGKYRWDEMDTILNYWKARNKEFLVRLWVTDDPGWDGAPGNEACPAWLWQSGVKYREYTGEGKSRKREPDYADPGYGTTYLPRLRKFLTAFSKRYVNTDSGITVLQVMGYGQWGEWHTLWSRYPWPSAEIKHNVLTRIIKTYLEVFKTTQLSIAYCFDHDNSEVKSLDDFLYRQAHDLSVSKRFVMTRHGFIDGLQKWDTALMQKYWRQLPLLAEGDWSYTDMKNHGTHGTPDENLDVMLEWHSNFAHFYFDADSYRRAMREDRTFLERGLRGGGLGYRFVLKAARWRKEIPAGDLFLLSQAWTNRNVGRSLKSFPLQVSLIDTGGNERFSEKDDTIDQTQWLRGEDQAFTSVFHLPKNLAPGTYDLRVAMVDRTSSSSLNLAIQGADSKKRYRLGTIQVLSARPRR